MVLLVQRPDKGIRKLEDQLAQLQQQLNLIQADTTNIRVSCQTECCQSADRVPIECYQTAELQLDA